MRDGFSLFTAFLSVSLVKASRTLNGQPGFSTDLASPVRIA